MLLTSRIGKYVAVFTVQLSVYAGTASMRWELFTLLNCVCQSCLAPPPVGCYWLLSRRDAVREQCVETLSAILLVLFFFSQRKLTLYMLTKDKHFIWNSLEKITFLILFHRFSILCSTKIVRFNSMEFKWLINFVWLIIYSWPVASQGLN